MYLHRGTGGAPHVGDLRSIFLNEVENLFRRIRRLSSHLIDPAQEKFQPTLPVTSFANVLEQVIILFAIGFEIETEVENRLSEQLF